MDYDIPHESPKLATQNINQTSKPLAQRQRYLKWIERTVNSKPSVETNNAVKGMYNDKATTSNVNSYFEPSKQHDIPDQTIKTEPQCEISQQPATSSTNVNSLGNAPVIRNVPYISGKRDLLKRKREATNKCPIKNHLRVAIIDKSNPEGKVSQTAAELLEQQLMKALDGLLFSQQQPSFRPTFYDMFYVGEFFKVFCENENSLNWLRETVQCLPQLWNKSELAIVETSTLPGMLMNATLHIPYFPAQREKIDVILHRLDMQNPWANIKDWSVRHFKYSVYPKPSMDITFGIKAEYEKALQSKSCMLFYEFSCHRLNLHVNGGYC